jgi:pimeloyl-ACP methyl ester carboxylesterase
MGPGGAITRFAAINGLALYYQRQGTGRPLVLIHGALMTIGLMKDYPLRLAADRQVIAVELQGHGHTADIDRPLRFELLAGDIVALLDHLGLPQADLFGYSIGAAVALQVAIRHPARVGRVVAASATYRTEGLHPEITAGGDDGNADQLQDSPYHRAYQAVAPDPQRWPTLVAKIRDLDAQPQNWPAEQVAAITAPTMLIAADNDIVRLEHAVEMIHLLGGGIAGDLHGIPDSRLAVIPGTTHAGLCDRAEWVVPMIDEFLNHRKPALSEPSRTGRMHAASTGSAEEGHREQASERRQQN